MLNNIAKDLTGVASNARHKANYLRMSNGYEHKNYEQTQSASEVLEEVAKQIDNILAKYFVLAGVAKEDQGKVFVEQSYQRLIDRHCMTAIRNTIRRKKDL